MPKREVPKAKENIIVNFMDTEKEKRTVLFIGY